MAYDEGLAAEVRAALSGHDALTERAMFGGLGFMLHGHMAVGVSGRGGLMVRVDPEAEPDLVASSRAEPMEMNGRRMRGWVRVPAEVVDDEVDVASWVEIGAARALALPPK